MNISRRGWIVIIAPYSSLPMNFGSCLRILSSALGHGAGHHSKSNLELSGLGIYYNASNFFSDNSPSRLTQYMARVGYSTEMGVEFIMRSILRTGGGRCKTCYLREEL
jgi:hypothetical protein